MYKQLSNMKEILNNKKVHEVSLMQGWVRTKRFLAIVSKGTTSALFIFANLNTTCQILKDVFIERVIPIDANFKFDFGINNYI